MGNVIHISQLEDRITTQHLVTSFILAHLANKGLLDLDVTKMDVEGITVVSDFHSKAREDIHYIFENAKLALDTLQKRAEWAANHPDDVDF